MSMTAKNHEKPKGGRKPGDKFPARTGNMVIIRLCSDEIQAMRLMGCKLSFICDLLSKVFNREASLLTPHRLSASLHIALKSDSETERELRIGRINILKGDMTKILQNLKVKSVFFNKDISSLMKASEIQTAAQTSDQAVSPVKAKPAQAVVVKPEEKPEAVVVSVGKTKPVISPEMKKWIDKFFLMSSWGTPSGLEKDYVAKYVADHWEELNAKEAEIEGSLIKEIREVFSSYKKKS